MIDEGSKGNEANFFHIQKLHPDLKMRKSAVNDRFIFMADYSELEEMLDPTWLKEDRPESHQSSEEEQIEN